MEAHVGHARFRWSCRVARRGAVAVGRKPVGDRVSTVFPGYPEDATPVGEPGVRVVDGDVALLGQQFRDERELPVLAVGGVGPVVLADMGMGGRQVLPVERRLAGGL